MNCPFKGVVSLDVRERDIIGGGLLYLSSHDHSHDNPFEGDESCPITHELRIGPNLQTQKEYEMR